VLVATTVIEVGLDVANASVMVVMDADRFGVSQLHQLRGRIGRGAHRGVCLLVCGEDARDPARERLSQVAATNDGFELSRLDLENRREGDVLGSAQSGWRSSLRLLRVTKDEDVIVDARQRAAQVVSHDPDLADHPVLARHIARLLDPEREVFLERG
jgi:ATP-dependent DNA helicase RecG